MNGKCRHTICNGGWGYVSIGIWRLWVSFVVMVERNGMFSGVLVGSNSVAAIYGFFFLEERNFDLVMMIKKRFITVGPLLASKNN